MVMKPRFSRSLATSIVLMVSLLVVSMVLNRSVTHALDSSSDISLATSSSQFLLGETIIFTGSLSIDAAQEVNVANITLANLTGANLTGANLTDVSLDAADLTDADLTNAIMVRTTMDKAKLCRTKLPTGVDSSGC